MDHGPPQTAAGTAVPRAWLPQRRALARARTLARLLAYVSIAAAAMVPIRLVIATCDGWWRTPSAIPMTEAYVWWGTSVMALALAVAIAVMCARRARRWRPGRGAGHYARGDC